jgi:drug/metabolite transporter (DMT)-like permease
MPTNADLSGLAMAGQIPPPGSGGGGGNNNTNNSSNNNMNDMNNIHSININNSNDNNNDDGISIVSSHVSVAYSMVSGLKKSMGQWKVIGFGQIMALLLAARGCASQLLYVECDAMAPAFVLCIVYGLLMVVYFTALVLKQRQEKKLEQARRDEGMAAQAVDDEGYNPTLGKYVLPGTSVRLHVPWHKYMIMTVCEVEANYLTLISLKYTSVKSASLLDTLGLPTAMLASYFLLHRRYTMSHLLGAAICMFGATVTVFSDYKVTNTQKNNMHPQAVFGDIMAAVGGMLYGISDVLIEEQVKISGRTEFTAMLGLFGTVLCAIQVLLFELPILGEVLNPTACSSQNSYLTIMFVVAMFCAYYMGLSRFLIVSEAAFLNLSLLTSDMWSVGFSIVEEHDIPTTTYLISMFFIMIGVLIYESVLGPIIKHPIGIGGGGLAGGGGGMSMTELSTIAGERETAANQTRVVELPPSFKLT